MRLPADTGYFVAAVAQAEAGKEFIGDKLHVYPTVKTTMDIVDNLIAGGREEGTMVIALDQTGGQGGVDPKTGIRRKWQSRRGNFMASSIIAIPPGCPSKQGEVVAEYALRGIAKDLIARGAIQAKFPNDLLVDGRKICGTVIFPKYALLPRDRERRVNLGIGVNLAVAPAADRETTCFRDHGIDIGVGEFAALFKERLSESLREYREHGFVHILKKMGLADPVTGAIALWPNDAGPCLRGYYHDFSIGPFGADPEAEFMQLRLENGRIASIPTKAYSARAAVETSLATGGQALVSPAARYG